MKEHTSWKWDQNLDEELFEIRKHLHQYPELSFKEYETSKYIQSCLENWGIPFKVMAETGVVVDILGGAGDGPNIALRADIDALPIHEESGLAFSSKREGVMHACGHDGHTTILLGTVYHIWKFRHNLKGMVRCIFQPGEEADGAAKIMIDEGVLQKPKIEEVVALHLWPKLPLGSIGIKTGPVTAACDDFDITIKGKSGHAARPHEGIDAISIGAEIIRSLQYFTAKWKDPADPLVIHVGKVDGGSARNVIADEVRMEGTIRSVFPETRLEIKSKFISFVTEVAKQYGGEADINYDDGIPSIVNDKVAVEKVRKAAAKIIGTGNINELSNVSMGADDFGFFADKVSSCYFRLGIREMDKEAFDLHHPKFQFKGKVIPIGAKILTEYAFIKQKGERK
ncbi:M20 metallopeptidase family protein [Bacillus norwichensis]|uniref:Amidohydrolase n=1 Tax=Bacillus norwichensis TaxID=2762217 RepID=A0ABR8VQ24_9BACI|nr:M20 family metallopeptidase [Bacillus norwichensis]MBD8006864.1 amidohydrolase [Bacillus norwichensis]